MKFRLNLFAGLLTAVGFSFPSFAAEHPSKLASSARVDLLASSGVEEIRGAVLVEGNGDIRRMDWLEEAQRLRSYSVSFSVVPFAWTKAVVRFVPEKSGSVRLDLLGPWEKVGAGNRIYRQEVYWDALSAEEARLRNGGFEGLESGELQHWTRPYGNAAVLIGPVEPVEGVRMVRTWHDAPIRTTMEVTGGVPVFLTFHARSVLPEGGELMQQISSRDTPAHRAIRNFRRGVNLGNYLEAPPGRDWGASYSEQDFVHIKKEGFDHVRIPVGWHHYTGGPPDYELSKEIFGKVDFLVNEALKNRLGVIVNIHHFDHFTTDPEAYSSKFLALWRQVAEHYKDFPSRLVFELLNEPKDNATTKVMNPIYARAIDGIRKTNPDRTIFVGPGQFNSASELVNLRLPDQDHNLVAAVHCYDPFLFTHQGASWTMPTTRTTGIRFPGPPDEPLEPADGVPDGVKDWVDRYNSLPSAINPSSPRAFESKLKLARAWSNYFGRPVHVGEFGCYDRYVDDASRVRYYGAMVDTMEALNLGWAMWDWKAGFHYWTEKDGGRPDPRGLREVLFNRP